MQRTKEIGVRKVLGASVSSILILLSKEFSRFILMAIAIAGMPTPIRRRKSARRISAVVRQQRCDQRSQEYAARIHKDCIIDYYIMYNLLYDKSLISYINNVRISNYE